MQMQTRAAGSPSVGFPCSTAPNAREENTCSASRGCGASPASPAHGRQGCDHGFGYAATCQVISKLLTAQTLEGFVTLGRQRQDGRRDIFRVQTWALGSKPVDPLLAVEPLLISD